MTRGEIRVVGLGPGALELLSWGAIRAMQDADRVLVRTAQHPVVAELPGLGIQPVPLDEIYERAGTLEEVYRLLAERVIAEAEGGRVAYGVPGHPTVGEASVALLLAQAQSRGLTISLVPSLSALDAVLAAVGAEALEGLCVYDAQALPARPEVALAGIYLQVEDRLLAGELKLWLLENYPGDHPVTVVTAAGAPGQVVRPLPLAGLDGGEWFDHLTSVFLPPLAAGRRRATLDQLAGLMARLRAPEGCPWDRKQTHASLRHCLLEECHEVLEALDRNDPMLLREELGDLLLQILFHAQLAAEAGDFDLGDVLDGLQRKLVERHPHVFGDISLDSAEAVLHQWEQIKRRTKPERESALGEWPATLPALAQAWLVQKRAARVGFDWPDHTGPLQKVREESDEVLAEWQRPEGERTQERLEHEAGDLLFAAVNLCRHLRVDPEQALLGAVTRFVRRFHEMERRAAAAGRELAGMPLDEMDALWEDAKEGGAQSAGR